MQGCYCNATYGYDYISNSYILQNGLIQPYYYGCTDSAGAATAWNSGYGLCGDFAGIALDNTGWNPNFNWSRECCCKQNIGDCDCAGNLLDGCDVCGGNGISCGCESVGGE